jgi:hypothetical protein
VRRADPHIHGFGFVARLNQLAASLSLHLHANSLRSSSNEVIVGVLEAAPCWLRIVRPAAWPWGVMLIAASMFRSRL